MEAAAGKMCIRDSMRTPEFKEEFDQVIEALRSDRYEGILELSLIHILRQKPKPQMNKRQGR